MSPARCRPRAWILPLAFALAAFALAALAGCVRVKPHQRETLSARQLDAEPWPGVARGDAHVFEVREGTSGAGGNPGGGCGCN